MSIRAKVLNMVDVMMRVPPILIIDEILKIGMGLPTRMYATTPTIEDVDRTVDESVIGNVNNGHIAPLEALYNSASILNSTVVNATSSLLDQTIDNATEVANKVGLLSNTFGMLMDTLTQETVISEILSITTIKFTLCVLGLLCAACIFMLWTRHLVMVYMFLISFGLTFLSYWSNISALAIMENKPSILEELLSLNMARIFDSGGLVMALLPHLVSQWLMGMLFAYIHLGPRFSILQKSMPFIFTTPILLAMLPLPPRVIKHIPILASFIPLLLNKITLMQSSMEAGKTIYNGYHYAMNFISNFGLSALIENEWQRLNVPSVLRVFWTIRVSQEFICLILTENITSLSLFGIGQKLLVDGCETLTAVLGMTAVISVICHYIGKAFQWYLLTIDNDEEKSLGTVSAVLFYILALQTGLTSLSPDKRFVRLCRNMCLLLTALLHFLHNIVSPILMSLSAARNPSKKRHIRALTVCAFLVVAPVFLLYTLWTRHKPSTWLLAVTAFSIEVVVKVLVSLATYTLFLLDARRQSFWEKLDDYLYYVRAFGNSIEFCFGILLFFNGAWILIFESGGAIRAIMMCIHAYFNIWCEARAGWSVFMKRRSAVHKISALPEATPAQLQAFDDVCAICYQEMYSAKITRCRHYFHGVCLRKWLYVQDRCPLCHEIMMYTDKNEENDNTNTPINHANNRNFTERRDSSSADNETPQTPTHSSSPELASRSSAASAAASDASNSSNINATVSRDPSSTAHSFLLSPNIGVQD